MPVAIKPAKIRGPWTDGYVLDRQTVVSRPTGDPYYRFETTRTELGELVYQLKYHARIDLLELIVETAVDFIQNQWPGLPNIDCITTVPPSVTNRQFQPAVDVARGIAARLAVPICENAIVKVKLTPQMKDIQDVAERSRLLKEAVQKGPGGVTGKRVLLFDDVIDSGATLSRVAEVLRNEGAAVDVFVLALTRTKRRHA